MERKVSEVQRCILEWATTWEEEFGNKYIVDWGKDMSWMSKLIEMNVSPDEYIARRKIYFATRNVAERNGNWWDLCRCSLAGFVNNINKFVSPLQRKERQRQPVFALCIDHNLPFDPNDPKNPCPECQKEIEQIIKNGYEKGQ